LKGLGRQAVGCKIGNIGLKNESPILLPGRRALNFWAIISAGEVSIQWPESLGKADLMRSGFSVPEGRITMVHQRGFYSLCILRGYRSSVNLP